jgi:adenine C2-methylase RlmN of 23S rRNA A2503 and tRNA A37
VHRAGCLFLCAFCDNIKNGVGRNTLKTQIRV